MADFVRMPHPLPPLSAESRLGGLACRIEGSLVPYLAVNLDAGQIVLIAPEALLSKDPVVALMPQGDVLTVQGPGHIGLSRGHAGAIFPIPLPTGDTVIVRAGQFLAALGATRTPETVQGLGDRLTGGGGVAVDRFTAGVDGAVIWVAARGEVFERGLIDGEMLDLTPSAFLCKDPQVAIETVTPNQDSRAPFAVPCLRLTGPGRVAFQTGAVAVPLPAAAPIPEAPRPSQGLRGVAGSFLGRAQR